MGIRINRDLRYRASRNNITRRPKTFKTEEAAKKYAEEHKMKNYTLHNLKSSEAREKKIRIDFLAK